MVLGLHIIVMAVIIGALVVLTSRWIEGLYVVNQAELSFPHKVLECSPEQLAKRLRLRNSLMFIFMMLINGFCLYIFGTEMVWGSLFPRIAMLFFSLFMVSACASDWEQRIIFDQQLAVFAVLGAVFVMLSGVPIVDSLLAAFVAGAVFLLLAIISKGGIGGGDVKLVAAMGLWLGTSLTLSCCTLGIIAGGICAFIMLIVRIKKRKDYFAYGPYFAIAGIICFLSRIILWSMQ